MFLNGNLETYMNIKPATSEPGSTLGTGRCVTLPILMATCWDGSYFYSHCKDR